MLFYPGSLLAPGHYFVLIRALLEAGFGVAALHLPGHGLCRGHWWQTFTLAQLLEQGLRAEECLRALGHQRIVVGGHSQGAILALAHAHASTRLDAVCAISGVLPQMPEAADITLLGSLRRWRPQFMAALAFCARIAPWLPVPLPAYLSLGRMLRGLRRPMIVGRDLGRISYPLKYLHSLFAAHVSPLLHCPTLLLGAVNDSLFPPGLLELVYAQIQAPRKALVLARDGGHTAPFNNTTAGFLARSAAAFCAEAGFPLRLGAMGQTRPLISD